MKTIIKNYEIQQHSTFDESIKLTNINHSPTDVTSWVFYGKIQKYYESISIVYLNCTITNGIGGLLNINIDSTTTGTLLLGNYIYDITAKLPNNVINRVQSGVMTVTYGVVTTADINLPPLITTGDPDQIIDGGIVG
jgi:hypothetical protein